MSPRLSHDLTLSGPATEHQDLKAARARFAYSEVADWSPNWRADATTRVQGLPIQVRTQGLLVTLAVLTSGADDQKDTRQGVEDSLARTLTSWLLVQAPYRPLGHANTRDRPFPADLLEILTRASRADHAAAQREVILLLDQIKIFAKALHGQGD